MRLDEAVVVEIEVVVEAVVLEMEAVVEVVMAVAAVARRGPW